MAAADARMCGCGQRNRASWPWGWGRGPRTALYQPLNSSGDLSVQQTQVAWRHGSGQRRVVFCCSAGVRGGALRPDALPAVGVLLPVPCQRAAVPAGAHWPRAGLQQRRRRSHRRRRALPSLIARLVGSVGRRPDAALLRAQAHAAPLPATGGAAAADALRRPPAAQAHWQAGRRLRLGRHRAGRGRPAT
eukprot:1649406-Pleurochrysis_carterae.AAC.1